MNDKLEKLKSALATNQHAIKNLRLILESDKTINVKSEFDIIKQDMLYIENSLKELGFMTDTDDIIRLQRVRVVVAGRWIGNHFVQNRKALQVGDMIRYDYIYEGETHMISKDENGDFQIVIEIPFES